MGASVSMPAGLPVGHGAPAMHRGKSETAPAQHRMVELVDSLIDAGNYARAAKLAATCRDQAPTTQLRRRFTGLLRFALSRLPA